MPLDRIHFNSPLEQSSTGFGGSTYMVFYICFLKFHTDLTFNLVIRFS